MAADGKVVIESTLDNKDVDKGFKELQTKLKDVGDSIKSAGENLSKYLTVPLIAAGGFAFKTATDFDSASRKIQSSLGLTSDEANKLADSAYSLWQDGFGESLDEVTNSLLQVRQNIKGLNEGEIEEVTKNAMVLANTFDSEVNEVTRAGNNLMVNFGIDSKKAFDLMAKGAQNGLNFSNEMFDNLSEYSGLFSDMGYSADEYFQLLVNGAQEGVYNLDYINDVMKEFQIRVKDGSKATSDAMSLMSEETQEVWESFLDGEGTVKDVSNAVLSELKNMDDQVLANQIGVGLYGTKWEDLEADAMYSLTTMGNEMNNVNGTMQSMTETQEEAFGQQFQSLLRELLAAFLPLGRILLNLAQQWLPSISAGIQTLTTWFTSLSPLMQNVTIIVGVLAAALGPLLIIIGAIASGISAVIGVFTPLIGLFGTGAAAATGTTVAATGLGASFTALLGPIGLIIAAIAGIIAIISVLGDDILELWNTHLKPVFDVIVETIVNNLQPVFEEGFNFISEVVNGSFESIQKLWDNVLEPLFAFIMGFLSLTLVPAFQMAFGIVSSVVQTAFNMISTIWTNTLKPIFDGIIEFVGGVFTMNWEKAWQGISSVFGGVFNGLVTLAKTPLNAIIGLINGVIRGLNNIRLPDWVPGIGGFGVNIPEIPMLAKGGNVFGNGSFIAGEAGPELFEKKGSQVRVTPLTAGQKAAGKTGGGDTFYVTIDAKNVKEFNDVVKLTQGLKSAHRTT